MNCAGASTAGLLAGDKHYRAFVGAPEGYDVLAALQFNLLTALGLREAHHLLDIGCGSLRAGRLFIPYLLPGRYCGLEPEQWLVEQGIENEVGHDLVSVKQPAFAYNSVFDLSLFGRQFDFVLAQSVFSHASARQITTCLREASRLLKPSGIIAATFVLGDEDYAGSEWAYPRCVCYTEAGMKKMAAGAGLGMRIIDWPHPEQMWMLLCHAHLESRLREPAGALTKLDPSALTVDEFLEEADGWGYVDEQRTADNRVFVRGWARNAETNQPAKDIVIMDQNGRVVASAVAWAPRKDVAEFFKEPALEPCGFVASLPKSSLRRGQNRLSVYAFLPEQRRAIRLKCTPDVMGAVICVD